MQCRHEAVFNIGRHLCAGYVFSYTGDTLEIIIIHVTLEREL
jgi:hypothetical protein